MNMFQIISKMFLGNSPIWYKSTIIVFLVLNPILLLLFNSMGMNGSFIVGWLFLLEFIFTLALALKCYPLQPGGLLAIEAIVLGLTSTESVYHEINNNLEVATTVSHPFFKLFALGPPTAHFCGDVVGATKIARQAEKLANILKKF